MEEVDGILVALRNIRLNMEPTVAADFALGQKVSAIQDPRWVNEPDALMGNSILHARDPGFGWLHYVIRREEARRLAEFLSTQVNSPDPTAKSGRPN